MHWITKHYRKIGSAETALRTNAVQVENSLAPNNRVVSIARPCVAEDPPTNTTCTRDDSPEQPIRRAVSERYVKDFVFRCNLKEVFKLVCSVTFKTSGDRICTSRQNGICRILEKTTRDGSIQATHRNGNSLRFGRRIH